MKTQLSKPARGYARWKKDGSSPPGSTTSPPSRDCWPLNYIGIIAAANVVNKAGLLAELRKDKNIYEAVTNDRPEVRVHGNTAVAVGTTRRRGRDAAGKEFNYLYRWTDTWVERDGAWQCVASQSHRQTP